VNFQPIGFISKRVWNFQGSGTCSTSKTVTITYTIYTPFNVCFSDPVSGQITSGTHSYTVTTDNTKIYHVSSLPNTTILTVILTLPVTLGEYSFTLYQKDVACTSKFIITGLGSATYQEIRGKTDFNNFSPMINSSNEILTTTPIQDVTFSIPNTYECLKMGQEYCTESLLIAYSQENINSSSFIRQEPQPMIPRKESTDYLVVGPATTSTDLYLQPSGSDHIGIYATLSHSSKKDDKPKFAMSSDGYTWITDPSISTTYDRTIASYTAIQFFSLAFRVKISQLPTHEWPNTYGYALFKATDPSVQGNNVWGVAGVLLRNLTIADGQILAGNCFVQSIANQTYYTPHGVIAPLTKVFISSQNIVYLLARDKVLYKYYSDPSVPFAPVNVAPPPRLINSTVFIINVTDIAEESASRSPNSPNSCKSVGIVGSFKVRVRGTSVDKNYLFMTETQPGVFQIQSSPEAGQNTEKAVSLATLTSSYSTPNVILSNDGQNNYIYSSYPGTQDCWGSFFRKQTLQGLPVNIKLGAISLLDNTSGGSNNDPYSFVIAGVLPTLLGPTPTPVVGHVYGGQLLWNPGSEAIKVFEYTLTQQAAYSPEVIDDVDTATPSAITLYRMQ
jgi:hypothetical protein